MTLREFGGRASHYFMVVLAPLMVGCGSAGSVHLPAASSTTSPSPTVQATIFVGEEPDEIAIGDDAVWVTTRDAVARIDPRSNQVTARIDLGFGGGNGIALDGYAVWVARAVGADDHDIGSWSGELAKIDARTNQVADLRRLRDRTPMFVTVGAGSVWFVGPGGPVTRMDPRTGKFLASIPVQGSGIDLVFGDGALWVALTSGGKGTGTVARIDPASDRVVATVALGADPGDLALGPEGVWVASGSSVTLIDSATNAIADGVKIDGDVFGVALDDGTLWVTTFHAGRVSRIDIETHRVTATIRLGRFPADVAIGHGSVWVTNYASGMVTRIGQ